MDRERFDALARLFATTGSRRAAIGALLGAGILGTGVDGEAKKGKGRGGKGTNKDKDRGKDRGKDKGTKRKGRVRAEQLPARCCSRNRCAPGPGANLGKCCFEGANFAGQNFQGANLGSANFSDATLTNANFQGANLGKACLVEANLTGAIIDNSTNTFQAVFCRTTMPDGSINNSGCNRDTICCPTGVCSPAENCAAGPRVDCPGQPLCAQVQNMDGGCVCAQRACSGQACTTGSQCASGLCITAPGCCVGSPDPFCGAPCSVAAARRSEDTTPGVWRQE